MHTHDNCCSHFGTGLSMKDYLDGKESQYKELLQATGALAALSGQRPGPITVCVWSRGWHMSVVVVACVFV